MQTSFPMLNFFLSFSCTAKPYVSENHIASFCVMLKMTCLFCFVSCWNYHLWFADNWRPQIFWWLQCILENQLRWVASRSHCKFCMPFICPGCEDNYLALTTCVNDDWKKTEHFQINSSSYQVLTARATLMVCFAEFTLLVSASSLYFSPATVMQTAACICTALYLVIIYFFFHCFSSA